MGEREECCKKKDDLTKGREGEKKSGKTEGLRKRVRRRNIWSVSQTLNICVRYIRGGGGEGRGEKG